MSEYCSPKASDGFDYMERQHETTFHRNQNEQMKIHCMTSVSKLNTFLLSSRSELARYTTMD